MWKIKLLALIGILLAFFLRVHSLEDENVWWDEGLAIWAVRQSWFETTLWTAGDVHPPLYFWLLWLWVRIAGESEFLARYLTVIAATITVAAIFPLTCRLGGPKAGLLALWFLTVSRFHVWWSQEMRMYVPAALFFTFAACFSLKAASLRYSWRSWVGLGVSCWAALYTLYLSVFLLPLCAIPIITRAVMEKSLRWKLLAKLALVFGTVGLMWVPWLILALPRMQSWSVVENPPSLGFTFKLAAALLATGISTYVDQLLPFGLFAAILAFAGLPLFLKREGCGAVPGVLMLLGGVFSHPVAIWALSQPRPLFYVPRVEARYFIPFAPFFYSLLALSLVAIWRKWRILGALLIAITLALMAVFLPQYYAERDWEDDITALVRLIQVYGRPGDAVVLISGDRFPEFAYYYSSPINKLHFPLYTVPCLSSELSPATVEAELEWIIRAHPRVWLAAVKSFLQDPEGIAVKWLSERMNILMAWHFKLDSLYLFSYGKERVVPSRDVKPFTPLDLELSGGVKLKGYDLMDRQGKLGATIHLGLFLELERPAFLWVEAVSPQGNPLILDSFTLEPGYHYRLVGFKIAPLWGGVYRFRVRVNSEAVYLGEIRVRGEAMFLGEEEITNPLSAKIGDKIRLKGYNLVRISDHFSWRLLKLLFPKQVASFYRPIGAKEPVILSPGDILLLELFWEADAPVERSYTVFTHLVGPVLNPATGKPVWAQDDQEPMEGLYPTTHWFPNVMWRDRYELILPRDAPPGGYILEVGMYLRETGERLPVSGEGADQEGRRIVLRTIKVED